jgi:hypothetical protein
MASVEPDVADFVRQIAAIKADASGLGDLSQEAFDWQPAPGKWSGGQCLEHLNITHRAMLPGMQAAAGRMRAGGRRARGAMRHGFFMRWFIADMEPPPKRRYATGRGFVPTSNLSREHVLAEFMQLHDGLLRLLEEVNGYDLGAVRVQSPFAGWMRYKLGSAIALNLAHDRRHLWQARAAVEAYRRTGGQADRRIGG